MSQFFLKTIPLPNGPGGQLTYSAANSLQTENQFMTKIDYTRQRHQLSGRYFFTDFDQPPEDATQNLLRAAGNGNAVRVQNMALNYTFTLSPKTLFNTWFGLNQQRGGSLSSAPYGFPDAGMKIAAPTPPEMFFDVGGYFTVSTNHLGDFDRGDWTIRENVTVIKGEHELHFGGEAVRVKNHLVNTFSMAGEFEFFNQLSGDNLSDFILGRASEFEQGGGEFKLLRGTRWGFFAQDNWRVNQRLTLNLGLRWDPYFPYQEVAGRVTCYQPGQKSVRYPNAPVGLTYGGKDHDASCPEPGSYNNLANFAPRIGFAYRLTQDGKTSLRGGAGYYFIPPETSVFNLFVDTAPFSPRFLFNNVDLRDPFGDAGVHNPFPEQYGPRVPGSEATFDIPTALYGVFQTDYRIPLLTAWNLTLERQLGSDIVVRAAYVGNKGTYLSNGQKSILEANPSVYIPGASTHDNTQERRLNTDFSTLGLVPSAFNSHYNGLQLNVEKRFSRGLSLLGNYTWSKGIDDYAPGCCFVTNPFNRKFDHGLSEDSVAHVFKFSNVWELPKLALRGVAGGFLNGWALNSIITWQGGFPLTIFSGVDNSFAATNHDRADFLGGNAQLSSDRPHGEMIEKFFDTSKFVPNAEGTFGNSGKSNLRGPKLFNFDLGVLKTTRISERLSVQFRSEFFNLFNNVNFLAQSIDTQLSDFDPDPTRNRFGNVFQARDPRILQFALKFIF